MGNSHFVNVVVDMLSLLPLYRFSSSGLAKAKLAVDAARALRTSLLTEQKNEDHATIELPEWYPPSSVLSRPGSGIEKAEQVSNW